MKPLPDAHFGVVKSDEALPEIDDTDDDEALDKTPSDVIELLGFDPAEFETK